MNLKNYQISRVILYTMFFFSVIFSSFSTSARNPYNRVTDVNSAISEIKYFINNFDPNYVPFAYGYTINLNALYAYRSLNGGAAISLNNALITQDINKPYNSKFTISLYNSNGQSISTASVFMADGSNICPTNCDVNIFQGTPNLANGVQYIDSKNSTTYENNYEAMSSGGSKSYDFIRSIYISNDVINALFKANVNGIRVYHAMDTNTKKRCVYICGLDNKGVMITSSIYKADDTNLCPANCD